MMMTELFEPNSVFNGFLKTSRKIWEMTSDEYIESLDKTPNISEKNLDFKRPEQSIFEFTGENMPYETMDLIHSEKIGNMNVNFFSKQRYYGILLIAVSNNNVLGYLGAMMTDDKNATVKTIFVFPRYRKLGIGTKLFELLTENYDPDPKTEELSADGMILRKKFHKRKVEEALKNGLPVPQNVLEEYGFND